MSFLWDKLGHHFPFCAVPSFESYGAGKSPNPAGLFLFLAVLFFVFLIHSSFFCVFSFFVVFFSMLWMAWSYNLFTANASRTRKTKPSSCTTYSRPSSWLSSSDQWTCWRGRRVRHFYAEYDAICFCWISILLNFSDHCESGIFCNSWLLQCHRRLQSLQRSVKPLSV